MLAELQRFADDALADAGGWQRLLVEAGLRGRIFLPIQEYPDEEALALVGAAARLSDRSTGEVLEAFGRHLVPGLLRMYGSLLRPEWRTLDVIEHAEETVHRVVRLRERGARPPYLSCTRRSERELVVDYTSERRLCSLGRGIVLGIAQVKEERVAVEEPSCMLRGDAHCVLVVRLRI
jgi:hypothetical protein